MPHFFTDQVKNYVDAGIYVPTYYNGLNTAAIVPQYASFFRVNNIVYVSSKISFGPSGAGTWNYTMTLPIASNLTNTYELIGSGSRDESTFFSPLLLSADTSNYRALINGVATYTGGSAVCVTFMYEIK
jgi:hypothetical protein